MTEVLESPSVYVSEIEQIKKAKELIFDHDAGFGDYRILLGHGVAHPAKMSTELCAYLIQNYTKKGSTVLDCFGGSGTTGIIAALNERNAVSVELEPHFIKMQEKAREKLYNTLGPHGSVEIIQGDSRELSSLLNFADNAILSPPYAESNGPGAGINKRWRDPSLFSEKDKETIGKSYGSKRALREGVATQGIPAGGSNFRLKKYSTAITSPPYEHMHREDETGIAGHDRLTCDCNYCVRNRGTKGGLGPKGMGFVQESNSENQIGNLKKSSYLEAVKIVYSELFKVLAPEALCIVVVKPFQRRGKIIDLPLQTWKLLESCGFELQEVLKMKLRQLSFWRILQYSKNKTIPQLWHEYVLVCRKPSGESSGEFESAITSPSYEDKLHNLAFKNLKGYRTRSKEDMVSEIRSLPKKSYSGVSS